MDTETIEEWLQVGMLLMPVLYPVFLGFTAFIIRVSIQRRRFQFFSFLLDLTTTIAIGFIAAFAIEIEDISKKVKWAVVFLSTMVGPELISGILQLAAVFSRSPVTFVMRVLRAVGGSPVSREELTQMMDWERSLMEEIRHRQHQTPPNSNDDNQPD